MTTFSNIDPAKERLLTRRLLICLLLGAASGCVFVPSVMWNRAETNRRQINEVRVGQTLAEVRAIMQKDPEKREVRARFDGKVVEFWSYVTDYGRRLDSTITFIDGRVQEIRTTPWMEKD
ncbi:MAG TPA: hypothetical protein VN380_22805 [Thermoanaerobaculia bacterium]|jgi:hypothetical protein|nr:hypothetical protein [Thermoanaerobaculia bacterium]